MATIIFGGKKKQIFRFMFYIYMYIHIYKTYILFLTQIKNWIKYKMCCYVDLHKN